MFYTCGKSYYRIIKVIRFNNRIVLEVASNNYLYMASIARIQLYCVYNSVTLDVLYFQLCNTWSLVLTKVQNIVLKYYNWCQSTTVDFCVSKLWHLILYVYNGVPLDVLYENYVSCLQTCNTLV